MANPECKVPLVGVELMKRKFEQLKPRAFVGPGVNMSTSGSLYRRVLHQDVRRMKHFYILADKKEYSIAKITHKILPEYSQEMNIDFTEVDTADSMYKIFDDNSFKVRKPYKDSWYVTHRYFNHPIYKYRVYLAGESTAVIGREVKIDNTKIFRIVDILGDVKAVAGMGKSLRKLIDDNHYEYIDFYELGMDDLILKTAGFTERLENDENVIPNYFEPYECRNSEIYVQRLDTDVLCFKGDGDQDRPN